MLLSDVDSIDCCTWTQPIHRLILPANAGQLRGTFDIDYAAENAYYGMIFIAWSLITPDVLTARVECNVSADPTQLSLNVPHSLSVRTI